jgi:membrane associated rhomboid family serine protease
MRVTFAIVLVTAVAFIVQMAAGYAGFEKCMVAAAPCPLGEEIDLFTATLFMVPSEATSYAFWQFLTYMFMHADISHIAINMFVLLVFGVPVEMALRKKNFIMLYILAGIGSAVFHLVVNPIVSPAGWNTALLGASGAVFGVLAAYAFLYPKNIIWIFPGIPLPAVVAVIGIAGFELFSGLFGIESNIANFGHLGGLIVGIVFMAWWRKYGRKRRHVPEEYEWFWQ